MIHFFTDFNRPVNRYWTFNYVLMNQLWCCHLKRMENIHFNEIFINVLQYEPYVPQINRFHTIIDNTEKKDF